jgi:hypothetical protein
MLLKGSCHCKAVRFTVQSRTPVPYMHCYCSICRKTAGGSGAAINIMAEARTLKVEGKANLAIYRPMEGLRHFCRRCGSALWVWDKRWPEWIYPFASAIDTRLPAPRERQHIMLAWKAPWVRVPGGAGDRHFREYPREAIIDWHRKRRLLEK